MGIIQSVCQDSLHVPKTFISDYHVDIILESILGLENQDIAIIEHCSTHQVDEAFDQCNHFIAHELVDGSTPKLNTRDFSLDHIFDVFGDSSQIACYATLKHNDIKKCMEEYLENLHANEDANLASVSDRASSKRNSIKHSKEHVVKASTKLLALDLDTQSAKGSKQLLALDLDTQSAKGSKQLLALDLDTHDVSLFIDAAGKVDTEKIAPQNWGNNAASQAITSLEDLKSKCCAHLCEVLHKYCEYRHCNSIEEQLKNECYLLDVIPASSVIDPRQAPHSRFVKYTHWDKHTPYQSNGSVVLDMYSVADTKNECSTPMIMDDPDQQYIYDYIRTIRDEAQQELDRINAKKSKSGHDHVRKYSQSADVQHEIEHISAISDELQHELERISAVRHDTEDGHVKTRLIGDLKLHNLEQQRSLNDEQLHEASYQSLNGNAYEHADNHLNHVSPATDEHADNHLNHESAAATEHGYENSSFSFDHFGEAKDCAFAQRDVEANSSDSLEKVNLGSCSSKRKMFYQGDIDDIFAHKSDLPSSSVAQGAVKNAKTMLGQHALTSKSENEELFHEPERFSSLEELIQTKHSSTHRKNKIRLRHFVTDERYRYFAASTKNKRGFEKSHNASKV